MTAGEAAPLGAHMPQEIANRAPERAEVGFSSMSEAVIIEVAGEAAGAVFRVGGFLRFAAANPPYTPLDGKVFASVAQAQSAAARLAPPRGQLTRAA